MPEAMRTAIGSPMAPKGYKSIQLTTNPMASTLD